MNPSDRCSYKCERNRTSAAKHSQHCEIKPHVLSWRLGPDNGTRLTLAFLPRHLALWSNHLIGIVNSLRLRTSQLWNWEPVIPDRHLNGSPGPWADRLQSRFDWRRSQSPIRIWCASVFLVEWDHAVVFIAVGVRSWSWSGSGSGCHWTLPCGQVNRVHGFSDNKVKASVLQRLKAAITKINNTSHKRKGNTCI